MQIWSKKLAKRQQNWSFISCCSTSVFKKNFIWQLLKKIKSVIFCNVEGEFEKLVVIGKSARPHCLRNFTALRNDRSSITYCSIQIVKCSVCCQLDINICKGVEQKNNIEVFCKSWIPCKSLLFIHFISLIFLSFTKGI